MANGDVDVYVRFRSFLPGGGYDSSGRSVQGKTNVRGRITTTYLKGGVNLSAEDLGLTALDDVTLTPEEPCPSADPSKATRRVYYSRAAGQFYITRNTGPETDRVEVEESSGTTSNISFDAFGDSAHNAELL